jgi:hypothetical protein
LAGTVWNADSLAQKSFLGFYKYDNSVIWEKEYGISGDFEIRDVVFWNNYFNCVGNRVLIADSLKDEYVVRVNLLGDTLTNYSYIGGSDKSMNKIVKYGNLDKFYIAISFIDEYSWGSGEDIFIGKYNNPLSFEYSQTQFNGVGQDDIGDFIATSDGGAIMVGTNRSLGTKNANVFALKIGPNELYPNPALIPVVYSLVSILEPTNTNENFEIYPNPTSNNFQLNGIRKGGQLMIINAFGQVEKIATIASESTLIDISDLANGLYHLKFVTKEGIISILGKISKN